MLVDTKDRKVMGDEDEEQSPDISAKKVQDKKEEPAGLDLDIMLGGSQAESQPASTGDVMNLLDMLGTTPQAQP